MSDVVAAPFSGYELIDSGGGRKLERIADVLVDRPSPQAVWRTRLPKEEWDKATSVCERTKDGGGFWKHRAGEPAGKSLTWLNGPKPLMFQIRFTSFGHCGVFFEQEPVWRALAAAVAAQAKILGRPVKALNLFGYTGAASLAMAAAGANVFHVDSAKGVLQWGKDNAKASALPDKSVAWVHDDVRKFLQHSRKKDFRYDAILVDPPSWGHGADREIWQFEEHLQPMLDDCAAVLSPEASFIVLTSHTPGVQHQALKNALAATGAFVASESGDLGVAHGNDERVLPAGIYAVGIRKNCPFAW
jgi:23S rRNA (cytosine1962-C5)-methyltransferase